MRELISWLIKNQKITIETIQVDSLSTLPLKIISDFAVYIDFVQQAILPSIDKIGINYIENIEDEIYRQYLSKENKVASQQNYFINLFYVGIYHKLENFENEILNYVNKETDSNFKDISELDIDPKSDFFDFKNKFRLIANSIKHNDSYPKNGLEKYLENLDSKKKLKFTSCELLKDITHLEKYLSRVFSFMYLKTAFIHLNKGLNNVEDEQKKVIMKSVNEVKILMERIKKNKA